MSGARQLPAVDPGERVPSIYVHVPFCEQQCAYCDFYSVSEPERGAGLAGRWLKAVEREALLWGERLALDEQVIETLYLGGGTPSLVEPPALKEFLCFVRERFRLAAGAEITMEIQPRTVDESKLEAYARSGVTRFSVGVQTFDEQLLRATGRRHSVDEARQAIVAARGKAAVSVDLICAWPEQTLETWARDLEEALGYGPDHISVYELTFHAGTAMARRLRAGKLRQPEEELRAAMFEHTARVLGAAGYEHYEISNFARPGARSRHNENYWKLGNYLGLGAGAHSFIFPHRYENANSIARYEKAIGGGRLFCQLSDASDREIFVLENLQMGLRLAEGVELEWFGRRFGVDVLESWGEKIARLEQAGLVVVGDGRMRMTFAGWLKADAVLEFLL